jgi:hypothetical protein
MTIRQLALRLTLNCIMAFGAGMFLIVMLAFNSTAHSRDPKYLFAEAAGGYCPLVALVCVVAGLIACAFGWRKAIAVCTFAPWCYLVVAFGLLAILS